MQDKMSHTSRLIVCVLCFCGSAIGCSSSDPQKSNTSQDLKQTQAGTGQDTDKSAQHDESVNIVTAPVISDELSGI